MPEYRHIDFPEEVVWVMREWLPDDVDALAMPPSQPTFAGWTILVLPPDKYRAPYDDV